MGGSRCAARLLALPANWQARQTVPGFTRLATPTRSGASLAPAQRTRVVPVSRRLTTTPTNPASVLCPQCKPVADLNKEFDTSIDLNGAPWEAAALIGFLLLGRVAVYVALRKKTQR